MAFNYVMQLATANVVNRLPPSPTVVEWGNQRFRYEQKCADACAKIAGRPIRAPVNFVWEYFEDLGFSNYLAIDINTELRSVAMDLNFILKDKYDYHEQFDLVTNNGTGEHIFDQRTVFENMHNLCKVGGIMLCVLPFGPWINHGFYNFNPNLFRDIVAANEYEWSFFWLALNSGVYIDMPVSLDAWPFFEQKKPLNPISDLEEGFHHLHNLDGGKHNVSLVAAYKKVKDQPFRIPMQGRYVNDVVDELKSNYSQTNIDRRQGDHTSATY